MKYFIELSGSDREAILQTRFFPKLDGKNKKVVVDETKNLFKGRHEVQNVYLYVVSYDNNGDQRVNRVYLNSNDIIRLSNKIKEIEEKEVEDIEVDDLPF